MKFVKYNNKNRVFKKKQQKKNKKKKKKKMKDTGISIA